jgi:hypothetical protein
VVGHGRERRGRVRAHGARVDDAPDTSRAGGVDRRSMPAQRHLTRRGRGDEEHLLGVGEGVGKARGIVEVAAPDAHAALGERGCLPRVADAHAELVGRHPLEQTLEDGTAELPGSSWKSCAPGSSRRRPTCSPAADAMPSPPARSPWAPECGRRRSTDCSATRAACWRPLPSTASRRTSRRRSSAPSAGIRWTTCARAGTCTSGSAWPTPRSTRSCTATPAPAPRAWPPSGPCASCARTSGASRRPAGCGSGSSTR